MTFREFILLQEMNVPGFHLDGNRDGRSPAFTTWDVTGSNTASTAWDGRANPELPSPEMLLKFNGEIPTTKFNGEIVRVNDYPARTSMKPGRWFTIEMENKISRKRKTLFMTRTQWDEFVRQAGKYPVEGRTIDLVSTLDGTVRSVSIT